MAKPNITFYGGVGKVTGANFLFEAGEAKVLVDCGLIQGMPSDEIKNYEPFAYDAKMPQALFVTHAHLDHVGRIPKLLKEGFDGDIFSTPETRDLARLILEDASKVLGEKARRDNRTPLYTLEDVQKVFLKWKVYPYHEMFEYKGLKVEFFDAGHILGSAMIAFTYEDTKTLFTGDLGNSPSPLLRDTEVVPGVTTVVIESVYGDRTHESQEERRRKVRSAILRTVETKGVLVIPAFSIERTQVILYEFNDLFENEGLSQVPVYVDSPLATKVTEVYKGSPELFNDKVRGEMRGGDDVFFFSKLQFTPEVRDSEEIDAVPGPKIIIAGSGMSIGGRVARHEALYLPHKENTILLPGYQTLGTLGRKLQDGIKEVTIDGRMVRVKAKIETVQGYSSHKDGPHLVEFIEKLGGTVKRVFTAMGEPRSSEFLAQRIRDYLDIEAIYPEENSTKEVR